MYKPTKETIIILLIIIIFIIYLYKTDFYLYYNSLPYRKVNNKYIEDILICLPTIDRDINKANEMYSSLKESIDYLKEKKNIKISIVVITRESDIKSILFWKDKAEVIKVPHYSIEKTHNLKKVSEKFNTFIKLVKKNNYDALCIIESDVYVNYKTLNNLFDSLKNNHISFAYGDLRWAKYPLIVVPTLFKPIIADAREQKKNATVLGGWTGAVAIRSEVFDHCNFNLHKWQSKNLIIEGQDVGFYNSAFKNRYKVSITDEVFHDYM